MKTARRHELQTNTLADWLGESIESAKPFAKLIGGIALAGVVLVIFYFVMQSRSQQDDQRGWQRYYRALSSDTPADLEQVAKEFPSTPAGFSAHLIAADRHLIDGCNGLFTDRAKAAEALQLAVSGYKAALPAKDVLVQQRAMFGLAKTYEAQIKLDDARQEYQRVIDRFPKGMFADVAQKRLDNLNKQPTKDFYAWFSEAEPITRPTGLEGFGTPGSGQSPFLNDPSSGMPNDDVHRSAFPFSKKPSGDSAVSTDDGELPTSIDGASTEGTTTDETPAPEGDKPESDKPAGETSEGDKPVGDKPAEEAAPAEPATPESDKPATESKP